MNIRESMEERELELLSPYAAYSGRSRGRDREEEECDVRTVYQRDRDRILHSKAFRRMKDKTQVFLAPEGDHYKKIPQIGNVLLEDDVEIGANTCIDRATMGSTIIKKGVKLDNLVQIAHNVVVGGNTVIAAQSGIAGTTKVGENCVFGGQVGIVGHLNIGSGTQIAAQSGITSNIPEKSVLRGSPAFDYPKYQKCYVMFRKLPELYGQIKDLEKEVNKLKSE